MPTGPTGPKWLFNPSSFASLNDAVACRLQCNDRPQQTTRTETQRQVPKEKVMNIQSKTLLITGANRGIGWALVEEALKRGAKRVYAGTRSGALENTDNRVTPITLDVTNTAQIQAAVQKVESLDVLINNAGVALYDDLTD